MNEPKRAVIYTRVSRDDSGIGRTNERQAEDGRALARMRDWEVVDVVDDISKSAYSGKTREGWETVKEMMRAGLVDVVIAWKMDRVTRTVRELTDIITLSRETGIPIVTTEGDFDLSTDAGKMMATVLGAVAEMEVERKGARQRRANQQRREEGVRWSSGWRPFGYELDGALVPKEATLIRIAAEDVLTGTPIREIARHWREAGVSTPRSGKGADGWTHNGVRQILLNPRNAGLNTYKGEVVGQGNWEAIFSEETHVRLRALLTDPARTTNRGRLATNLLSGIAACGKCGAKVTGGTVGVRRQQDGISQSIGRKPVYKCPNDHLSTDREEADNLVVNSFALTMMTSVRTAQLMPLQRQGRGAADLEVEIRRLAEEMDSLAESYVAKRITLSQMEKATAALTTQLEAAERDLASAVDDEREIRLLITENVDRFREMSTQEQREVLARVARIRLFPKGRGRKKVPMKHQIEMDLVTFNGTGEERIIPALAERPRDLPLPNDGAQARTRARGDRAGRL